MGSEIQTTKGNGGQIIGAADMAREAELRELVRRSVFPKSTDDELSLYMHDCQRQGCHPLDRLIHPTIRIDRKTGERRYTPVTSIDLMRSRADETGQYAGNDEPVFEGEPGRQGFTATVTVWKIVGGVRCPFPGTARWEEYYPGDELGFMWRSKPHVMLGKVAEARALRKGFPRQLARLYEKSELDRVDDGWTTVEAQPVATRSVPSAAVIAPSGATVRPSPQVAAPLVTVSKPRPVEQAPAPAPAPAREVPQPVAPGDGMPAGRPTTDWMVHIPKTGKMKMSEASEEQLGAFIHWQEAMREKGQWKPEYADKNAQQLALAIEWRAYKQAQSAPQDDPPMPEAPPEGQAEFDEVPF